MTLSLSIFCSTIADGCVWTKGSSVSKSLFCDVPICLSYIRFAMNWAIGYFTNICLFPFLQQQIKRWISFLTKPAKLKNVQNEHLPTYINRYVSLPPPRYTPSLRYDPMKISFSRNQISMKLNFCKWNSHFNHFSKSKPFLDFIVKWRHLWNQKCLKKFPSLSFVSGKLLNFDKDIQRHLARSKNKHYLTCRISK